MTIPEYLLTVAKAVATRSKCRRPVGCVMADINGIILSTGYNGYAKGLKNCTLETCTNPSENPGPCESIHAEINAALWCPNPGAVHYVAVTRLPCVKCAMVLLNTNGKVLIYSEENSYLGALELLRTKYETHCIS